MRLRRSGGINLRKDENPIEDSLITACNEFLHIVALTGNNEGDEALQRRFSAIFNVWRGRYMKSKDPYFPHIMDYVPGNQWDETTKIYKQQVIQFVGDLADYLLNNKGEGS